MIFSLSDITGLIETGLETLGNWALDLGRILLSFITHGWNLLRDFGGLLEGWVKKLGSKLRDIWRSHWFDGLRPVVHQIWSHLKELYNWIHVWASKVHLVLQHARAIYDRYWKRYILPIINVLSKIRAMLFVLSLMHVKFAKTLDGYIAKLENRLAVWSLAVRQQLINLSALVDTILLAPSLFHPLALFGSLAHDLKSLRAMLSFRRTVPATAKDAAREKQLQAFGSSKGHDQWVQASIANKGPADIAGILQRSDTLKSKYLETGHI